MYLRSFKEKKTYAPISRPLSYDGSRVKVEILQREVAFDIVREVFVFLSTEKRKKMRLIAKDMDALVPLFLPQIEDKTSL